MIAFRPTITVTSMVMLVVITTFAQAKLKSSPSLRGLSASGAEEVVIASTCVKPVSTAHDVTTMCAGSEKKACTGAHLGFFGNKFGYKSGVCMASTKKKLLVVCPTGDDEAAKGFEGTMDYFTCVAMTKIVSWPFWVRITIVLALIVAHIILLVLACK